MQHAAGLPPSNRLLVSDADHDRLTGLARAFLDRAPDTAEELLSEMDRAVTIRAVGGDNQRITLVYPGEADIAENRISVLTPMGTALIGAAIGEVVCWSSRDGRELSVTIEAVDTPASCQRS